MKIFVYLLAIFSLSAAATETVGRVATRGLVMKDHIEVVAFDDPEIAGITCYVTAHDRSLSFNDGSDAAITCMQTAALTVVPTTNLNVFQQSKSLVFKSTVVSRFYDARRHALIYLVYTVSTEEGNNAHAISVVPIR